MTRPEQLETSTGNKDTALRLHFSVIIAFQNLGVHFCCADAARLIHTVTACSVILQSFSFCCLPAATRKRVGAPLSLSPCQASQCDVRALTLQQKQMKGIGKKSDNAYH